jgi:hypothetical protein
MIASVPATGRVLSPAGGGVASYTCPRSSISGAAR